MSGVFLHNHVPMKMQNFNASSCIENSGCKSGDPKTCLEICCAMSACSLTCKSEIPGKKPPMQLPADWVCYGTLSRWTNCTKAVEEPSEARQVRDRGQPEEHHPDPTSSSLIADNPMDGTTEFLEETWHCFYEHQVMLMFSSSSSVKLTQHTWDAKEAHCTSACLSKSHQEGSKTARIHTQCSVEDSNFAFVGYTTYSKLISFPPPLK